MKKQDLTAYGTNELSLIVQNTEYWYNKWTAAVKVDYFKGILEELYDWYIYTNCQLDRLKEDFEEDRTEYVRECEEEDAKELTARY